MADPSDASCPSRPGDDPRSARRAWLTSADEGSANVWRCIGRQNRPRDRERPQRPHSHYAILSIALRRNDPVISDGADAFAHFGQPGTYAGGARKTQRGLGIELGGSSGGALFFLPALPAARTAPTGEALAATVRDSGRGAIDLDLGEPKLVRTIGFDLRWHYRELETRIAIETSLDGQHWLTAWEDWTGGRP